MSIYSDQKETKPKPKDVAGDFISEDKVKNLMDLLAFLKDNKMTLRWASWNSWCVKFKSKTVCHIKIRDASWFVMLSTFTREQWFVGYDEYFADNELKEFIWANNRGSWCPRNCKGHTKTILGKEINDICGCWGLRVENPEGAALERSKRVILAVKDFITDLAAASKS